MPHRYHLSHSDQSSPLSIVGVAHHIPVYINSSWGSCDAGRIIIRTLKTFSELT